MEEQMTNPHIFTNRRGNTLIREFEGILQHNPQIRNLDAVVGFLRASGYFSLRPFLDNIGRVRVLIGIDVDKYIAQAARQGKLFFGAEEEVKGDCLRKIRKDIEASHYKREVEEGMFQMVQDLLEDKLELRAHPSKRIHAKLYVLYPDNFNQYTQGMAITGSSNLSGNGLGISQERQYEFNVQMDEKGNITFSNYAPNMDSVEANKLLDRYYTISDAKASSGIGLSISNEILQEMGGELKVRLDNKRLYISIIYKT